MRRRDPFGARGWTRGAFVVVAAFGTVAACAKNDDLLTFGAGENVEDASAPSFIPSDASIPDQVEASTGLAACVSSECPEPYTTCPSTLGLLPRYKCSTNLSNDRENCGSCGNSCAVQAPSSVRLECVAGECVALCPMGKVDCNGVIDDGCETDPETDAKNCGACGNACAAGVACIDGVCGCPPDQIACAGKCIDPKSDDANCGACGFACTANQPDGAAPPSHMFYGCGNGTCSELKCQVDSYGWADCNNDRADGCELALAVRGPDGYNDAKNCGGCGVKCDADEKCFEIFGSGVIQCQCPGGKTICGTSCADLEGDIYNCGSCGYSCGGIPPYGQGLHATCEHGRCGMACDVGKSDCNGNIEDGCEADLLQDPSNCGGCGISCDVGAGQPCVNGTCVTQACEGEAGVTK